LFGKPDKHRFFVLLRLIVVYLAAFLLVREGECEGLCGSNRVRVQFCLKFFIF